MTRQTLDNWITVKYSRATPTLGTDQQISLVNEDLYKEACTKNLYKTPIHKLLGSVYNVYLEDVVSTSGIMVLFNHTMGNAISIT